MQDFRIFGSRSMQDSCTKSKVRRKPRAMQGPRTMQESRNKGQGPRAKDQESAMHGPTPCRDQGPRAKEQEPTTKGQGQKHIVHFNESFVPIQSFRHQIAVTAACGPWCAKPSHGRTACSKLSDPNLTPFPTHTRRDHILLNLRSLCCHIYIYTLSESHKAHATKDHAGAMDREPRSKSQVYTTYQKPCWDPEPRNN